MERMVEIVSGSFKKCPNTPENLTKIVTEFSKHVDIVKLILINMDLFSSENRKYIIEIFGDLMKTNSDSNPLAVALEPDVETTIDKILTKFDITGMSIHYSNALKIMTNQKPLIKKFLKIDMFRNLSKFIVNEVFDISSEALSLFEEILFSENKDVQRINHIFLNEHKVEMMELFMGLFEQDNYLAKREAMKVLHEILLTKGNDDFHDHFVSQKDHLKFTMISLNDDSTAINVEAFHLLVIFLQATDQSRDEKVNETLKKN